LPGSVINLAVTSGHFPAIGVWSGVNPIFRIRKVVAPQPLFRSCSYVAAANFQCLCGNPTCAPLPANVAVLLVRPDEIHEDIFPLLG